MQLSTCRPVTATLPPSTAIQLPSPYYYQFSAWAACFSASLSHFTYYTTCYIQFATSFIKTWHSFPPATPDGSSPALSPNLPIDQPSPSVVSSAVPQSLLSSQGGEFFRSTVVGELQKIKHDINSVKSDLHAVERITHTLSNSAGTSPETNNSGISVLYIRLEETYDPPLGKLGL